MNKHLLALALLGTLALTACGASNTDSAVDTTGDEPGDDGTSVSVPAPVRTTDPQWAFRLGQQAGRQYAQMTGNVQQTFCTGSARRFQSDPTAMSFYLQGCLSV